MQNVIQITDDLDQKIDSHDIIMTVEIIDQTSNKPVYIEHNSKEIRDRFILCTNHNYQLTIKLLRDEKSSTNLVRQINEARIIGLLKSGLPLLLNPQTKEGTKVGDYQICSFTSATWSLHTNSVDLKKRSVL